MPTNVGSVTQDAAGSLRSNVTTAAGMFAYGLLNTDPVTVKMVAGDTFFPPIDWSAWRQIAAESLPPDEKNEYPTTFCTYVRNG